MLKNWRSNIALSRLAFQDDNFIATLVNQDIYKPTEYIALNSHALQSESTLNWAKENFGEYGFDFDTYSMLLWPMNDDISADVIVARINSDIPKLASIKVVSPALAHGLDEVATLSFEDTSSNEEETTNLNINIAF